MNKNGWMTEFYGKDWFEINSLSELDGSIENALIEWRISSQNPRAINEAESNGFKLVESVIEFTSEISPDLNFQDSSIIEAKSEHLDQVLDITQECFLSNKEVQTRFKNEEYFTKIECAEYYKKSIVNNFQKGNVVTVVAVDQQGVAGYYMIKKLQGNTYKGVMTGVLPRARGQRLHLRMQQATFGIIGLDITVVNSTQLSNFKTIKSHIRANRVLSKIEHIFYKLV